MKQGNFSFFHEFSHNMWRLFLYNTVKEKPEGTTYSELKKYGDIPHSRIYRAIKKLEEEGDLTLRVEEPSESGRPKHFYSLSKQGMKNLNDLREKLGDIFKLINERFIKDENLDYDKVLDSTFKIWGSPLDHLLQNDWPPQKKLKKLQGMENHFLNMLEKIKEAKIKLQREIKKEEYAK